MELVIVRRSGTSSGRPQEASWSKSGNSGENLAKIKIAKSEDIRIGKRKTSGGIQRN